MTFEQLTPRQKAIILAVGDLESAGDEKITGQDIADILIPKNLTWPRYNSLFYAIRNDCFRLFSVGFVPVLDPPRRVLVHSYDPDLLGSGLQGLFRNLVFTLGEGDGTTFYNQIIGS